MKKTLTFLALLCFFACKKDSSNPGTTGASKWNNVFTDNNLTMRVNYSTVGSNMVFIPAVSSTTAKILKSTDSGKTWSVIDTKVATSTVYAIAFSSENTGYISLFGKGTYSTEDGGTTWRKINADHCSLTADNNSVTLIKLDSTLYSTDKGHSFTEKKVNFYAYQNFVSSFRFGNKVYAYFNEGLVKSTDGGQTWEDGALNFSEITCITPVNENKWYLNTGYDGGYGLFVTQNAGATWTQLSNGCSNLFALKGDTIFVNKTGLKYSVDGQNFHDEKFDDGGVFDFIASGSNILGFGNNKIYRRQ